MNNYLMINKLCLLIYCTLLYIEGEYNKIELTVVLLLLYIFTNTIVYVIKKNRFEILLFALPSLIVVYLSISVSSVFIFLLIPSILDVISLKTSEVIPNIFTVLIPTILIPRPLVPGYSIIAVLFYTITCICVRTKSRLETMDKQTDDLRRENDKLRRRAAAEEEYKSQLLYVGQLEERNAIAQEIHDSLGHTISASVMQLEAAKLLIHKDSNKTTDIIQNVISSLRNGMDDIRFTLRNIKPPREQIGINRLRLLLEEYKKKTGFEIYLTHKGDTNVINVYQWKIIYDNAVEALTNTQKYSKATSMNVSIEILNKIIKIEYRDNGIGAAFIEKGIGLKGMEERCASLGGKVIIDGSRGFSVIVLLPVENT